MSAWYVHGMKQDANKIPKASRLIHLEYLVIKKKAKGFYLRVEVPSGFEPL